MNKLKVDRAIQIASMLGFLVSLPSCAAMSSDSHSGFGACLVFWIASAFWLWPRWFGSLRACASGVLFVTGGACNAIAMLTNGGYMPVLGMPTPPRPGCHVPIAPGFHRCLILCDVQGSADAWHHCIFSIGDSLIFCSFIVATVVALAWPKIKEPRP